jgi:hypothetical protein
MRNLTENQDQKIMTEMTETVEKVEMVEIVGMGETKANVDPVEISSKSLWAHFNLDFIWISQYQKYLKRDHENKNHESLNLLAT